MAFILPVIRKDQQLFVPKNKISGHRQKSHSFAAVEHRPSPALRRPKSKSMSAAVVKAGERITPVTQIEMRARPAVIQEEVANEKKGNETVAQKMPRKSSISNLWSRLVSPKEQAMNKKSDR